MTQRVSTSLGSSTLSLETGRIAKQADGSVLVQQGGTVVLVAAVYDPTPDPEADIVPLTVDYREKTYAAGRIPGGFFKREGRPSEKEILTARLIDRPIRPLFPHGFQHELQIMAMVLSSDGEYDPDVLAVLGAATALRLSALPFPKQPLAAARVGLVDGQFVLNPTYQQLAQSSIDVVVEGTPEGIISLEAGFREISEQQAIDAVTFGYEQVLKLIALQEQLIAVAAQAKSTQVSVHEVPAELIAVIRQRAGADVLRAHGLPTKDARKTAEDQLRASLVEQFGSTTGNGAPTAADVLEAVSQVEHDEVRRTILESGKRFDGRSYTQLRPITCEVGVLPRTHGSALFTRGETQSLAVTTLGTSHDEQQIEALEGESFKRFMLHYNFPPFSVGEVRPIRGPGRREIGHGALAERALAPLIPSKDAFPYTIRVVSDILESNGSSSMATVCAGTLALMDAGVPIARPASGVAMGLVKEGNKVAILTDISGLEDHQGDMDFKVAGTRSGLTALQVDVKRPEGLTLELIQKILTQSHPARLEVLETMTKVLEKPRTSISTFAPRIVTFKINPEKIRDVIGPSGRTIRKIIDETGVTIDIEDDGSVSVASSDLEKTEKALAIIRSLTEEPEVGKVYKAKVKRIMNFGAFCEFLPGKEGLVHISELEDRYVNKVEEVVKIGDEFTVKVIEIDEQGRVNLSRKRAMAPISDADATEKPRVTGAKTK